MSPGNLRTSATRIKRSPLKRWGKAQARSRSKYGNISRLYAGVEYHSKLEAEYAMGLDLRMRSATAVDRIMEWRRQISVKLEVNGVLVCRYIVDFLVTYPDGREEWIECKGYPTPEALLKMKLFRAIFPDRKLTIVRAA